MQNYLLPKINNLHKFKMINKMSLEALCIYAYT